MRGPDAARSRAILNLLLRMRLAFAGSAIHLQDRHGLTAA